MCKKVILLTSTNLACNPRCLKELRLLLTLGYKVSVVAFHLHNWTTDKEVLINKSLPEVDFHYLEPTRKKLLSWLRASMVQMIARALYPLFSKSLWLAAMLMDKRTWFLTQWLKQLKSQPQFIIAHNPATFYPAFRLAQKQSVPFALDIEDYHPGEAMPLVLKNAICTVMAQLLPKASYVSFAAPLIKEYVEKEFNVTTSDFIVINNVFPQNEFQLPVNNTTTSSILELVWFSQFIDYNRGLEKILLALDECPTAFKLTLIGTVRADFYEKEIRYRSYVECLPSMPHEALQKALSQFDIGLAIEDAGVDINRNLCLTNKIWSYYQAGLYILASDTDAQKLFMAERPEHGVCTNLSKESLKNTFKKLLTQAVIIRESRLERLQSAKVFNWENEAEKLNFRWQEMIV